MVAIVSDDNGFKAACGERKNYLLYKSLGELYDAMNREERAYQDAVKIVTTFMTEHIKEINGRIRETECVEVHGVAYDKDGIADGYDYSETIVSSVRNTAFQIRTIDEITETVVRATILCTSKIDVECFYEDYENAAWDSETKSYLYLDTKKILEKHSARFWCRAEVHRDGNDSRIFPFKVILNCDSLHERFEVKKIDNDYEQDIINQERKELGFCSLDCYEDYLEDSLAESDFKSSIIGFFNEMNSLYGEYEEIIAVYDDLTEVMNGQNSREIIRSLSSNLNGKIEFPCPNDLSKISDEEVTEVFLWVERECDKLSELNEKGNLPDTINYGQTIEMFENDELYRLVINELLGTPHEGDEENIDIDIRDELGNIVAKGCVKLTVGFINFDDNGCVGDGLEDSIEYLCDSVITKTKNMVENIKSRLREEKIAAKIIENIIAQYEE